MNKKNVRDDEHGRGCANWIKLVYFQQDMVVDKYWASFGDLSWLIHLAMNRGIEQLLTGWGFQQQESSEMVPRAVLHAMPWEETLALQ